MSSVIRYQYLTHCGLIMPYGDRSGSILAQLMAWSPTAPSHCLNQYNLLSWLIISEVLWHLPERNFTFCMMSLKIICPVSSLEWVSFVWIYWMSCVICLNILCNEYIDGLVQDCSISSALAMEILQSCTKPLIWITCMYELTTLYDLIINCWRPIIFFTIYWQYT